jgi:eukaryotic-like serine/threonine-protein kinase
MLQPGTRIDSYEIVEPIGAGGMGVIFRARDVRLGRDVAIKLLPDRAVQDSGAIARFRLEAQAASALNHPHILTIYDIGETSETPPRRYIAMEYIDGQTLRGYIAKRDRGVAGTLELLIQIGEGLAKAHEADIVHRDLKPDNIMITSDGYAKILDFGLAKLSDATHADSDATTQVAPTTDPGVVVGTPQYMSPEQLSGQAIDQRSDIFAFGAVAYEALSGQRAFRGGLLAETVHQITAIDPPPLRTLDERIPPDLQRVVSRCLAKIPAARYATMREVVSDLRRVRERMREPVRRFPRLVQLTFARAIEEFPALSPDGQQLVFAREIGRVRKLVISEPAAGSERQLTRGTFDDIHPAWSPDGSTLLFVRGLEPGARVELSDVFARHMSGNIWSLELESGRETRLVDDAFNPSWSPDGTRIAFDASWSGPRRIWIADARGRNPLQITTDDSEASSHVRPRWSSDGTKIVFQNLEGTKSDIRLVDVASRTMKWITDDFVTDIHPVWSFDGGSIFFSSYRTGGINVWSIPVDFDGAPAGPMQQITAGPGHDVDLDVPRSEHRLVFAILKQNAELWRLPVDPETGDASGPPEQVVAASRENTRGAWSPDGERIAFGSDRAGEMNLWLLTLRDGRTRRLTSGAGGDYQPSWSADGRSLAFFSGRAGAIDIWRYDFEGDALTRLTHGEGININPCCSPDGTRIAFMSDRDGRLEVYVMNEDGGGVRQLTTCGVTGHFLRWSSDGRRVIFRCPALKNTFVVPADGGEIEPTAQVIGGAHMSLSPDQSLLMDVLGHRTLWCSPLREGSPRKVFEFDDAESRIDYPVWSPDGKWILFDRFQPHGGDVWAVEE